MSSIVSSTGSTIPTLTEQQKKIIQEFKTKYTQLPPEQQAQFISQNKAMLLKQLNFLPGQIQLLKGNHLQQQSQKQVLQQSAQLNTSPLVKSTPVMVTPTNAVIGPTPGPSSVVPNPIGNVVRASTPAFIQLPNTPNQAAKVEIPSESLKRPASTGLQELGAPSIKQKRLMDWVESQVKKDQNEALNPNYRLPFKSKEDACKRLLRYHVFHELDDSPESQNHQDEVYEENSSVLLNRYRMMLDKYHYLLIHESMVSLRF